MTPSRARPKASRARGSPALQKEVGRGAALQGLCRGLSWPERSMPFKSAERGRYGYTAPKSQVRDKRIPSAS
jgi:hypothetical protein